VQRIESPQQLKDAMKYLVSADTPSIDAAVAKRFGRAAYQLVVEANVHPYRIEKCQRSVHDMPAHGLDDLEQDVTGVIAGNIGPEAFTDAKRNGLEVFIVRRATVREALMSVTSGEVTAAVAPSVRRSRHHHG
jgi:predicted Fe-Mo cluster-binding NifX family protein